MAHFAELDNDNIVLRVIVVSNSDIMDENGIEQEQKGIDFCKALLGSETKWVQTSYNSKIRKSYAGIGFTYDAAKDIFISPKPFPSWVLDLNNDWKAPVELPSDYESVRYFWDEDTLSWKTL